MSALRAVLRLVFWRARNRPARALLTVLGIATATAYGGGILAEGTVAGDQAARASLRGLEPAQLVVRITASGILTPASERDARSSLRGLGLSAVTEVVLLNPVRLASTVARPAAIAPLSRWAPDQVAACRPHACPMLALSAAVPLGALEIPGLRVLVAARAQLRSAAPLGFLPDGRANRAAGTGEPPVLLSGDPVGLGHLSALSGIYRTHSWFSVLSAGALHAWQLGPLLSGLQQAQTALARPGENLSLSAPFSALAAARSQADGAPGRLFLAGGCMIAVLALFLALAAGALRQDQAAELERLRNAGAVPSTLLGFVVCEAALVCAAGVLCGAAISFAVGAILARGAGLPVGAVLSHSSLSNSAPGEVALCWLGSTALVVLLITSHRPGLADAAAAAAVAALAVTLVEGGGSATLALVLAPLACLAGGVLIARAGPALLRGGERLARAGPPVTRLAFIGLARAPLVPSLTIAFLAVTTAIGGFALAYRATLARGGADQAANRVPLDALVSASADFTAPLRVAPLAQWRSVSGGQAYEVRRTDATFAAGDGSATVPAIGLPADALSKLHGWRSGDSKLTLGQLAKAISPPGPVRRPGPMLPAATRELEAHVRADGLGVSVVADLRGRDGYVRRIPLGTASPNMTLRARVPPGRWELEAFELREPTGLEITDGHQNAENVAAATRSHVAVVLEQVSVFARRGARLDVISLRGWRGVGALAAPGPDSSGARLQFATTGAVGVLRPEQPSDTRAIPVLVDPTTARAADGQHRLELTVDGAPISVRIAAVLRRFPTVTPQAGGFVVADESALGGALDAWLPGQGRSDELWLTSPRPAALRRALQRRPLSELNSSLRVDLEHALRSNGLARAVQGSLLAAAALSAGLALIGVFVSMLGSAADARVWEDLAGQGIGVSTRRSELRRRSLLTGAGGCLAGFGFALALTPLSVGAVGSAVSGSDLQPPLVTVTPWLLMVLWCLIMLGGALGAGLLGVIGRGRLRGVIR